MQFGAKVGQTVALVAHTLLWGWLTWRVMIYDALAEHASEQEYRAILVQHRWPLWVIGIVSSVIGNFPTTLWLGGTLAVVILPITATLSIWLYLLIFVFSGLWFQYYALMALHALRQHNDRGIEANSQVVGESLPMRADSINNQTEPDKGLV